MAVLERDRRWFRGHWNTIWYLIYCWCGKSSKTKKCQQKLSKIITLWNVSADSNRISELNTMYKHTNSYLYLVTIFALSRHVFLVIVTWRSWIFSLMFIRRASWVWRSSITCICVIIVMYIWFWTDARLTVLNWCTHLSRYFFKSLFYYQIDLGRYCRIAYLIQCIDILMRFRIHKVHSRFCL